VDWAVEIAHVTKRFPEPRRYRDMLRHPFARRQATALDDVTLTVRKGELFGVLGPNGAGKTTLLKLLCTLVLPTSGTARVQGHDVARDARAVRRSIGYVTCDERSFYWRLTARQNLRFFAALNDLHGRRAARRIGEVLELTGLGDAADRPLNAFSSGMKQRLAIARGLLHEPQILLMDEPTRTLDAIGASAMRRFVRERLLGRGCTVIYATNNLPEAEQICDRVAILDRGRLRACGALGDMRTLLGRRQTYRFDLAGCAEDLRPKVRALGFDAAVMELVPDPSFEGGVTLRAGVEEGEARALLDRMVACGLEVRSFHPEHASLEDLFSHLFGEEGR